MFNLKRISISKKMIVINSPIILVLVIALFIIISIYASKSAENSARLSIDQAGYLVESSFDNLLGQLKRNTESSMGVFKYFLESYYGSFSEFDIRGKTEQGYPAYYLYDNLITGETAVLDRFTDTTHDIATIFARDGQDFIRVTTSLKDENGKRAIWTKLDRNHPAYNLVLEGKTYIGKATLFGNDYLTFYDPIKDSSNNVTGILFIGYNLKPAYEVLKESVGKIKIGTNGYVTAIDKKKDIFTIGNYDYKPSSLPYAKELKDNSIIRYTYKGDKFIAKDIYNQDLGWNIIINAIENDYIKDILTLRTIMFIGIIIFILIFFTTVNIVIRMAVVLPLHKLTTSIFKFFDYISHKSSNEMTVYKPSGKDELVEISEAINEQMKKLQAGLREDNNLIEESLKVSEKVKKGYLDVAISSSTNNPALNSLKDNINDTFANLSATMQNILSVVEKYSANDFRDSIDAGSLEGELLAVINGINLMGSRIREMLHTSMNTCENLMGASNELKNHVDTLQSSAETQSHNLEKNIASLDHLNQSMEQVNLRAKDVVEHSEAIRNIIDVIHDVADQTDLLALNAAIEAARAGEHGRGFAVVADEVRKLAERTQKNLQEISSNTNSLVEAINDMDRAITAQTTEMQEMHNSILELQSVTESTVHVAVSTKEVSDKVNQISTDIMNDASSKEF
ncbi:MAG TPA: Cache 3/Cache 2 fusion domain-containing protein [Candidatus Mucispirillum faecigallinarum]|uniref:Cache 3/Cache 2 fusion domain-containing protein n=1 Tax=Candidatus Mucispirillum faecigallinarum TaxID=2838699 RepID=A0A9D2GT11_9BACT|nr:Cache 3/Cache 2 fusion domain-containing protein [Candidatus Mucispirillum faecigallinarum]